MKILVHGDKKVVSKPVKEYLETKLKRLDRYFENLDELTATVNAHSKNNDQKIEITIPTQKFTLRAEESNENLYASIDLAVDKLERQIAKNKAKIQKKYKNNVDSVQIIDFETEEDEENLEIVKRKNLNMKPMDEEEAILQMQLVNHDFFVFKNVDEECVSVIYKRKDETFGIINVK